MNEVDGGEFLLNRAYLLCRSAVWDQCLATATTAVGLDASPAAIFRASTVMGSAIPHMPAPLQRKAIAFLHKSEALVPREDVGYAFALARSEVRGETLLAENDLGAALKYFRSADTLDAPLAPREYLASQLSLCRAHTESGYIAQSKTRSSKMLQAKPLPVLAPSGGP